MPARVIFEGGLSVDATDYMQCDEDGEDVETEGLDERVATNPQLAFTLDYPFDKPYEGVVVSDAGPTLRQIIDAVRQGFRVMYRGATHEKIPNLLNERVEGDYGRAMHAITDLVIESIELDEKAGTIEIGIGS